MQSTHIEVRYQCDKCDFKTNQKDILTTHNESLHKGNENAPNIMDFIKRMRLQNETKEKSSKPSEISTNDQEEENDDETST